MPERSGVLKLEISSQEYKRRTGIVLDKMKKLGLDAFVFWNNTSVFYPVSYTHLDVYKRQSMASN